MLGMLFAIRFAVFTDIQVKTAMMNFLNEELRINCPTTQVKTLGKYSKVFYGDVPDFIYFIKLKAKG